MRKRTITIAGFLMALIISAVALIMNTNTYSATNVPEATQAQIDQMNQLIAYRDALIAGKASQQDIDFANLCIETLKKSMGSTPSANAAVAPTVTTPVQPVISNEELQKLITSKSNWNKFIKEVKKGDENLAYWSAVCTLMKPIAAHYNICDDVFPNFSKTENLKRKSRKIYDKSIEIYNDGIGLIICDICEQPKKTYEFISKSDWAETFNIVDKYFPGLLDKYIYDMKLTDRLPQDYVTPHGQTGYRRYNTDQEYRNDWVMADQGYNLATKE